MHCVTVVLFMYFLLLQKLLSSPAVENTVNTEEIDNKLRDAILEITSAIREKLEQFTSVLNVKDMKDIPHKVISYYETL